MNMIASIMHRNASNVRENTAEWYRADSRKMSEVIHRYTRIIVAIDNVANREREERYRAPSRMSERAQKRHERKHIKTVVSCL